MPSSLLPSRRQVCRSLALAGLALVAPPLVAGAAASDKADGILVVKSKRKLMLMRDGNVMRTFPVALGADPVGPKRRQGDSRTPEGLYRIDGLNPHSHYSRALHISYPNEEDLRLAHAAGVAPGGDIEIHGLPPGYGHYDPDSFFKDWTNGCIAVGNGAIEEIWARVGLDTPIEIRA